MRIKARFPQIIFGFICLMLSFNVAQAQVTYQRLGDNQPDYSKISWAKDRQFCASVVFNDSAQNLYDQHLRSYQDTILLFTEDNKDSTLLLHKHGKRVEVVCFTLAKKISGDYYEIKGIKKRQRRFIDTSTVFDFIFKELRLDTTTRLPLFSGLEADPHLRYRLYYNQSLRCGWIPAETRYDYGDDPRSRLAFRMDAYYKLFASLEK